MHIILAVLGAIATVLILFSRLKDAGIDIGWLNPFSWAHRRRWRKQFNADPTFMIESPLEAAAGLMYVAAKCSGEMTTEEKRFLLEKFQNDFKLSNNEATDLLSSHSFMIKDEDKIFYKLNDFLSPSLNKFTAEQVESTIQLVLEVIQLSNPPTQKQIQFLNNVKNALTMEQKQENW